MIIENEQKNEVIKGGNVAMEEKSMRIKASAKAFKVLSDSLYSDKIFAVIREVGCNAHDAHVDAGKPETPFEVVLPNSFSPNFIVRDFGTGISDGDMDAVYTVFFESTKTDESKQSSYDSTGMLGLGCKSPLSYTDSFVVESFMGGVKNSYSIYKNEDGIPCCVRMSTEDSDEPTGLKVTIPVKSVDFANFTHKAKTVFKPFKVKPIVTGNDIKIPTPNYYLEHEQFALRTRDWDGPKAIMGNISYPLDDLTDSSLSDMDRKILGLDVDFFFELGQLDFSASRERLSYDKTTIANIIKKVRDTESLLEKTITESVRGCDTLWDARVKFKEVVTEQNLNYICDDLKITYKGVDLTSGAVSTVALQNEGIVKTPEEYNKLNFFVTKMNCRKKRVQGHNVLHIEIHNNVVIVVDDAEGKRLSNRIRTFYDKRTKDTIIYVIKFSDEKYIDELKTLIGMESFLLLSEMEFTSTARVSNGSTTKAEYNPMYSQKMFLYTPKNFEYGNANSKFWTSAKVAESEEVVFVKIDRFKIKGQMPSDYFMEAFNALREIDVDPSTLNIYGVKVGQTIPEDWTPFEDFLKREIQDRLKGNKEFKTYCLRKDIGDDRKMSITSDNSDWKVICTHLSEFSYEPKFKILDDFFHKDIKLFSYSRGFYNADELEKLVEDQRVEMLNLIEELDITYPMLSCVSIPCAYSYPKADRLKVLGRACDYVNTTSAMTQVG